jgi:hypothetical protein
MDQVASRQWEFFFPEFGGPVRWHAINFSWGAGIFQPTVVPEVLHNAQDTRRGDLHTR